MDIKVIGITGRKYNGKDTLGNLFVSNFGYKKLAYANPLKEACRCIFNFNDDQLYGDKKEIEDEFWHVTPRKVFQYVGTDMFRTHIKEVIPHVENNIWVEVVKKQILDDWKHDPNSKFVVTDVRFPNEAKMIQDLGGIVVRVRRDCVNTDIDTHPSELMIEQLDVDYELPNNGTVDELYNNMLNYLKMKNN
jgi:hypothetical protein